MNAILAKNHQVITGGKAKSATAARLGSVTVDFGSQAAPIVALDSVSLELVDGELLVLVGKSGSGKTTALNVLAGLTAPTAGHADVLNLPPIAARPQLGYMFARDALLPWRTAQHNVEFGLEVRGVGRKERAARAREFLELVHLGKYANNYPHQLSQGQRQRVSMARTWAMSPRVMLMDEPFSALDAQTRESLHEEFLRLWARDKRSVVFVTHDLSEAITLADRILVFAKGRIVREFRVDFPRPRDVTDLSFNVEAREIIKEIRGLLYE